MISQQDRDWLHAKLNKILDKIEAEAKYRYEYTDFDLIQHFLNRVREEAEKII